MGDEQSKPGECSDSKHFGKNNSLCASQTCKKSICTNCSGTFDRKVYCLECKIAEENKSRRLGQQSKSGEMQVESKSGFKKTGGMQIDKETGRLIGWSSIFQQIEGED